MSRIRAVVLTEIIAPYRVPFLNLLAQEAGIDLEVLFMAESEPRRRWRVPKDEIRFRYRVLRGLRWSRRRTGDSLFFNPGVLSHLRRLRPHVVVCGGWHQPTCWLAATKSASAMGRKMAIEEDLSGFWS